MADAPATSSKSGSLGFLTKKVGPAPIWVYALIAVGVWYWYTHYGPGAAAAGSNASATAVDPSTGTTYAQELAAANQEISDLQGAAGTTPAPAPSDTGDVSPQTVAEQEQDIQELTKAQQEQEQDLSGNPPVPTSNWPGGRQPPPPITGNVFHPKPKKPGKGKVPPTTPVQRHNRNPRSRPVPVVLPPREVPGGPVQRTLPVAHPATPKSPADKETASMTRWRAA